MGLFSGIGNFLFGDKKKERAKQWAQQDFQKVLDEQAAAYQRYGTGLGQAQQEQLGAGAALFGPRQQVLSLIAPSIQPFDLQGQADAFAKAMQAFNVKQAETEPVAPVEVPRPSSDWSFDRQDQLEAEWDRYNKYLKEKERYDAAMAQKGVK